MADNTEFETVIRTTAAPGPSADEIIESIEAGEEPESRTLFDDVGVPSVVAVSKVRRRTASRSPALREDVLERAMPTIEKLTGCLSKDAALLLKFGERRRP